jgi:hypothetical protein
MTNTETESVRHATFATELPKPTIWSATFATSATEISFLSQMSRVARGPFQVSGFGPETLYGVQHGHGGINQ